MLRIFPTVLVAVLLGSAFFGICSRALTAEVMQSPNESGFVQWRFPVAIPRSSGPKIEPIARSLEEFLGTGMGILRSANNPGCCFWLEVVRWDAGKPGYIVIVQHGGSKVIASDVGQLKLAISRLQKLSKIENGKVLLPVGLITNYRVVKDQESRGRKGVRGGEEKRKKR